VLHAHLLGCHVQRAPGVFGTRHVHVCVWMERLLVLSARMHASLRERTGHVHQRINMLMCRGLQRPRLCRSERRVFGLGRVWRVL